MKEKVIDGIVYAWCEECDMQMRKLDRVMFSKPSKWVYECLECCKREEAGMTYPYNTKHMIKASDLDRGKRVDKVSLERIATSVLNGLAKSGLTDDQKVDYSIRMAEKLINKIDSYEK